MNTKNVHVIRGPTITKIVMLFSILMCILLYKPITAEATTADCDKGYGIPSPSTMVDLATGNGGYWSSGGSWQSWIDFYKSMGYTYTGYSDCYLLYGTNNSGHQTNEYVHGYWMDLTKNGQTYWAILRNDFGDTNTYYSRYNSWYCVNETLNGVNEYTWYYTNGIGIVYTNTWLHTRTHDPQFNKSDIHGYFGFNASGRMSVGWHKGTDGKWYYFRIDTIRSEDGANTRTGMSEHGGLIWNTVHSPTTYGANGLYSEGLYSFAGLDVATNVYRRNTSGTFDYVGTDVTRINAGSDSSQIEPFRSKKISSNTEYVNDQIYNTNALYINTNVAGTYTADQNVLLVNDDYQHIRVNEYTYYIDRKKFTLTQNINSDTETTKTSTIYYEGTQNIPTPTKTGYKFDGWEVSGNGSKMDGNTFTMGDADATITAKWTPIDYTIKCNTGGGQIASYPTSYNINTDTITIPQPTKPGYAFAGWTGSNGNTAQKTVTIPKGSTGDKTYNANWKAIDYTISDYTISYDLQGGTASGLKTSYNIETPDFSLVTPTKKGYTFTGWTGSNGNTPQTSVTIKKGSTGNKSYKANWQANTYSITYNLDGGSISGQPTSYNTETPTFTIPQPTRAGYIFVGWTGTDLSSKTKNVSVPKGSTGNRAYTAHWTPINYSISYDLQGGSISNQPTSYNIESDTISIPKPTKNGYTFIGWTGSNGNTPQVNVTIPKGSTGNKSYKANWSAVNYSISYNLDGGTIKGAPTNYNIETPTFSIPQPTRSGYTFEGWTGTGLSGLTKNVSVSKGSTGNRTYTAHWKVITYSITYDLGGGKISNAPTSYTVESNTITIPRPTKTGYTFLGWTGSNGNTNQLDVSIVHGSIGNKTYTAHWKINTYTMTVNHYKYNQHTDKWDFIKTITEKANYGTVYIPKYDTPTGYYNYKRDWDKGWTVTGNGTFNVYYYPNSYTLDVNTWLDGARSPGGYTDILFNVYINDKLVNSKVQDYCSTHLYGDTYKIEMISNSKYTYEKSVYEGTISNATSVEVKAQTVPVVERLICEQSGNDNFYVYAYVSGLGSLDRVVFPSWTDEAGQDDLNPNWQTGEKADEKGNWTFNGQSYNYRKLIKSADHKRTGKDEHNWYNIHVYAYNGYGGKTVKTTTFAFRYNVTFNYNKPLNATSTINNSSETVRKVTYNTAYGTLPNPSMNGWTFNGWYTAATGGNKVDGTNIYKYAYGTTLYAHWTANKYTLSFDYNKPSNASSNMANCSVTSKTVTYDSAYGELPNPSLRGWKFEGWYTSKTGGTKITANSIYRVVGNQTLYARWTANQYTLTFNYNKPSNASSNIVNGTITSKTVTYDSPYGELPAPTLRGWTFNGWFTAPSGGTQIKADNIFRELNNQTLYAHWTANKYTLSFDYNKPSNSTSNINGNNTTSKTVVYDSPYGDLPNPTLKGWTFNGWYTAKDGGTKVTASTIYRIVGNSTLYAHWTANVYTVSFDYNKPANSTSDMTGADIKSKQVTYDSVYGSLPNPGMKGWTFNGWYTSKDGGIKVTASTIYNITASNQTLYAHWSANIYEIKLDSKLEGCTGSTGTTVIYEKYDTGFYSDKACTKQITSITIPHKIGNAFNGYTDDRNVIIDSNGVIKVKTNYFLQNTTLSAKWTLNTYRVIFNGNRNSSGKTDTLVYTWSNSDTNNKALTPNGYIRAGWNYINWNTINNGKGTAYNNNQMIGNKFFIDNLGTNVLLDGKSHDVTLYAQWKDITVPDIKEVTAEQETLLSKVNSGQLTLTSQSGAYNGELYTNLKIKIDENNANKDASGIKNVSVLVYDKNNTTVQKTYDITNNISYGTNTKYDFGYDGKYYPYSGTYTFKVNLYKEFPNASKLGIYVYCTDAQGNTTKRNDIFTRPSVDIPQDKPIVIPDKPIEGIVIDEINECIYSQYVTVEGSKDFGVGETGITTTWTYGYVERYDLDYREINTEMENEIANNLLSTDNRMNRSHEIGRDNNGKAPLASVDNQIVRIPPYVLQHLSTPDTTKHDDGTTKYKDLLNNKYTATGYKGTQDTGIYNTYNIKDTEYQAVHYRSGV